MKKALALKNSASADDKLMGKQLTEQYERATGGMREALKFGAMMMMLRAHLMSTLDISGGKLARGTNSDGGIKKWIEEHAPAVQRTTAYRFEDVAKAVCNCYQLPKTVAKRLTFEQLVTAPEKELDGAAKKAREDLFQFVDGRSQKSFLDRLRPPKPLGGNKGRRAPADYDPNSAAEIARDLWLPHVEFLENDGLEERSWKDLPKAELQRLKDAVHDLNLALKGKA